MNYDSRDFNIRRLTKSSAWLRFISRVETKTLYSCLETSSLPDLGYLYLIESILGQYRFCLLCPLVLDFNKEFALQILPVVEYKLEDPGKYNYLSDVLEEDYLFYQCIKASRLWPEGIGEHIKQVLGLIVENNFTQSLWDIYKNYLVVRYGLDNRVRPFVGQEKRSAVRKQNKRIIKAVYRKVGIEEAVDDISRDLPWEGQTKHMFSDSFVISLMEDFASSFEKGNLKKWKNIVRKAEARFKRLSVKDPFFDIDSLLNIEIYQILEVRFSNVFAERGLFLVRDVLFLSEHDLALRFVGIGVKSIKYIKSFLERYGLWLGMSDKDLQKWRKQNRKRKFQAVLLS